MFDYSTLITDRTQADVDAGNERGTYDDRTLNRVTSAMEDLRARFSELGYITGYEPLMIWHLNGSSDAVWRENDEDIDADQFNAYIANVSALRGVLNMLSSTPQTPSTLENLLYTQANDIEKILFDIDATLRRMASTFPVCGEALCGGDYL